MKKDLKVKLVFDKLIRLSFKKSDGSQKRI